jgi:hypothetical protein
MAETNVPDPGTFTAYDQQQSMVLSGSQLDESEIPRRGASRANSVRFDDSATTNHWIHDSPGTSDYFGHRPPNGIGGYAMTERSSSHKSDTRSVRSFAGDTASLYEAENTVFRPPTRGSDILDSCLHRTTIPRASPAPAMVRCWLNAAASSEPLLYAVVCTGSSRSTIEMSLITHLGLQDRIRGISEKVPRIELTVLLPDAIVQQQSRITGPSKLPRLTVEFAVLPVTERPRPKESEVRIFLGSDVIASHMGDVLFSQNKVFLTVDDGRKVFIPFTRPHTEETFSDIYTAHASYYALENDAMTHDGSETADLNSRTTDAGLQPGEPASVYLPVSSPQPIRGGEAQVIRGVASMEFATKESGQNALSPVGSDSSAYQVAERNRPWTLVETRKESYGAESVNDSAQGGEVYDKGDNEAITRGRSLTNPFEEVPITVPKPQANSSKPWEGARKPSMTYAAPLKESNSGGNNNGNGTNSRGSSRGMKVLRTSKSFSSHQSNQQNEAAQSSTSTGPIKHASFATTKKGSGRGHSRTMSGDAVHQSHAPVKGSLVRTKSSNVVGGATAFHWMAPKTTAGSD